jgi:hypothetical protein
MRGRGRRRAGTVDYKQSLLTRIDCALYRLQNTHGLPLKPLGDESDPEPVLLQCRERQQQLRRVLLELREAVVEQVGAVQTDRLRYALADATTALQE